MRTAGIVTGRNLVIASVQSNASYPVFIHSDIAPSYRPNGGDLVEGDTWYSDVLLEYAVYVNEKWEPIGGTGFLNHKHDVDGGNADTEHDTPIAAPMTSEDPVVTSADGLALMVEDNTTY